MVNVGFICEGESDSFLFQSEIFYTFLQQLNINRISVIKKWMMQFTYLNLFPCCNECNKKGNRYDILLLKPDEIDYKFENYFRYDSFTGEILVNTSKSEENQKRAFETIEIFRLNIGNKPRNRITAIRKEIKHDTPFDERPYRYGYWIRHKKAVPRYSETAFS